MWQLYDTLIENIDPSRKVNYACHGGWRALIESEGNCGIASLLLKEMKPAENSGLLTNYMGKPLRDVAALIKSWDDTESALGMAAINAYYNDLRALSANSAQLFEPGMVNGDIFNILLPEAAGKKVAIIGHFRGVDELYRDICELTIFEREPREGDLPDTAEEYLLPDMELVIITGMSLTNKTLPRLLQLAQNAKVILTGPSAALTKLLFGFGVDMVSGIAMPDVAVCRQAIESDHWQDIYSKGRKVILKK